MALNPTVNHLGYGRFDNHCCHHVKKTQLCIQAKTKKYSFLLTRDGAVHSLAGGGGCCSLTRGGREPPLIFFFLNYNMYIYFLNSFNIFGQDNYSWSPLSPNIYKLALRTQPKKKKSP